MVRTKALNTGVWGFVGVISMFTVGVVFALHIMLVSTLKNTNKAYGNSVKSPAMQTALTAYMAASVFYGSKVSGANGTELYWFSGFSLLFLLRI